MGEGMRHSRYYWHLKDFTEGDFPVVRYVFKGYENSGKEAAKWAAGVRRAVARAGAPVVIIRDRKAPEAVVLQRISKEGSAGRPMIAWDDPRLDIEVSSLDISTRLFNVLALNVGPTLRYVVSGPFQKRRCMGKLTYSELAKVLEQHGLCFDMEITTRSVIDALDKP